MTNKLRLYDNTRISALRSCPRYFYFRHVRDFTGEGTAPALAFGAAWHKAMDVVWPAYQLMLRGDSNITSEEMVIALAQEAFKSEWVSQGMPGMEDMDNDTVARLSPRHPMVALEMLYEYLDARRSLFTDQTFKLLAVEQPFAVPLDPSDPTLFYVGRLDKVYEVGGEICIGEHKTTTLYKKNGPFMASFIEGFSPNSQIDGYLYATHMLYGDRVRRCMVDAALVHKEVHDGFRFIPVERRHSQLEAWLWETRHWIDVIEANKEAVHNAEAEAPYLAAFPKNTSACTNFGTCTYIDLCKMWSNPHGKPTPAGFTEKKWSPFDELELEKIGFKKEDLSEDE